MEDEIQVAKTKMELGKAHNISLEPLEALEDDGIDKTSTLLNKIYDTGQTRPDFSKSIFIAVPKKPGATESEWHRTMSL